MSSNIPTRRTTRVTRATSMLAENTTANTRPLRTTRSKPPSSSGAQSGAMGRGTSTNVGKAKAKSVDLPSDVAPQGKRKRTPLGQVAGPRDENKLAQAKNKEKKENGMKDKSDGSTMKGKTIASSTKNATSTTTVAAGARAPLRTVGGTAASTTKSRKTRAGTASKLPEVKEEPEDDAMAVDPASPEKPEVPVAAATRRVTTRTSVTEARTTVGASSSTGNALRRPSALPTAVPKQVLQPSRQSLKPALPVFKKEEEEEKPAILQRSSAFGLPRPSAGPARQSVKPLAARPVPKKEEDDEDEEEKNRVFKRRRTSPEIPEENRVFEDERLAKVEPEVAADALKRELTVEHEFENEADPNGDQWDDLDAEDMDDPFMVSEYAQDIFNYMKECEQTTMPSPDYMDNQKELAWKMRGILMDWLIQIHYRFKLLPETLFLACNVIDRFLSCRVVSIAKLQLVGVTAMFVASKTEEIVSPSVTHYLQSADSSYTEQEILSAERYILKTLDWNMSYPNPLNFLRRVSKADDYDPNARTLGKYLMELSCVEWRLLPAPPSLLSAAALWLGRLIVGKEEWTPNLAHYSTYAESQIIPTANIMLNYVLRPVRHDMLYKKYASKKYAKASVWVRSWALDMWPEGTQVSLKDELPALKEEIRVRKEAENRRIAALDGNLANETEI